MAAEWAKGQLRACWVSLVVAGRVVQVEDDEEEGKTILVVPRAVESKGWPVV